MYKSEIAFDMFVKTHTLMCIAKLHYDYRMDPCMGSVKSVDNTEVVTLLYEGQELSTNKSICTFHTLGP